MEATELNTQKGLNCLYIFYHTHKKRKNRRGQSLPQVQVWDLPPPGQEKAPRSRAQGHSQVGRNRGSPGPLRCLFPEACRRWIPHLAAGPEQGDMEGRWPWNLQRTTNASGSCRMNPYYSHWTFKQPAEEQWKWLKGRLENATMCVPHSVADLSQGGQQEEGRWRETKKNKWNAKCPFPLNHWNCYSNLTRGRRRKALK